MDGPSSGVAAVCQSDARSAAAGVWQGIRNAYEKEYEEEEVVLVTNAGRTLHSREIREWHAENESTPWCSQEEEVAKKSGVDGIVANISWNKVKYAIWWLGWAAPECGSTGTGSRQVPQEQIF